MFYTLLKYDYYWNLKKVEYNRGRIPPFFGNIQKIISHLKFTFFYKLTP